MKRVAAITAVLVLLAGCKRETRMLRDEPPERGLYVTARETPQMPGGPVPQVGMQSPAEGNAYSIAQGQQLFNQYNCSGCHSQGGGGMGPALMSKDLHFGSAPENIYDTIVKGRPNGMPSWGGRIPESQIWAIVAYVRSLSGQEPRNASPARSDAMEKKTTVQLK